MSTTDHKPTARELEIAQLELAIARTQRRHHAAHEVAYRMYQKLAAQEAELRFQRMLARLDRQRASAEVGETKE